ASPLDARLQDPCRLRQDPPDRTRGRGLTTKPPLSTQRGELQRLAGGVANSRANESAAFIEPTV
ncbi:MAG: hypothetical protein O3C60_20225, partial [Planctomycetota bacterium]|nr:hypothetical protein [Planctomycetota bacterium]